MASPALDQAGWQALTTWQGDPPTYSSAWGLLTDPQLPETFRNCVRTLRHTFLRQLQAEAGAIVHPAGESVLEKGSRWNNRFANLVSGRFTEKLFHQTYVKDLKKLGLSLTETTAEHDWLDFLIEEPSEGFILGINVKNAGVQFRSAAERVGLDPEDTLPIATYKIFGSTTKEGHIPLIYVYLVDWELLSRLRAAYWASLNDAERAVFQMMTSFRKVPRKLEDCFIEATVADQLAALYTAVGYTGDKLTELPFRAISGRRCQRIFYTNHERAPYVYVQRMDTDPNVHISVRGDTVHFIDFAAQWLRTPDSRRDLIEGLRQQESYPIPDPPI